MMKAQEKIKHEEINPQADALTDLPATDEQAKQTKAGAAVFNNFPVKYVFADYEDAAR
jgi:hypothetical protein